jgi:hypothetical protein
MKKLALLACVLAAAGCGGGAGAARTGHTVTFDTAGAFPTATIVGRYSASGCAHDARLFVADAHLFYAHSTTLPGPADLYFYDMRFDYAHFQADDCTSKQLGEAIAQRLSTPQRTWLVGNLSGYLLRAVHAALNAS